MMRKFKCEIEWEKEIVLGSDIYNTVHQEFCINCISEFEAVTYAMAWMRIKDIDMFNLMYCRVEEDFDDEMRQNVLLWIGE